MYDWLTESMERARRIAKEPSLAQAIAELQRRVDELEAKIEDVPGGWLWKREAK